MRRGCAVAGVEHRGHEVLLPRARRATQSIDLWQPPFDLTEVHGVLQGPARHTHPAQLRYVNETVLLGCHRPGNGDH
jgi:hypothetical protein